MKSNVFGYAFQELSLDVRNERRSFIEAIGTVSVRWLVERNMTQIWDRRWLTFRPTPGFIS